MFALGTGCDFSSLPDQVIAVGQCWVILLTHVIERPDVLGVVGQKYKVMSQFFLDILSNFSLTLWVHVTVGARHLVASGFDNLVCLG